MPAQPKCPKCSIAITTIDYSEIPINAGFSGKLRGVAYACPNCHSILGASIDPIALKDETVREVLAALGRK